MRHLLRFMLPWVVGLMLFGCKDGTALECVQDSDCDDFCPDDTVPVCFGFFPVEQTGTCECQPPGTIRLSLDFSEVASIEGLSTSVEGSVEAGDQAGDLQLRFQYDLGGPLFVSGVDDASTGAPLPEVDVGSEFQIGYELDPGIGSIRINFDCLQDGEAAGTVGLYRDDELVGDAEPFAGTCFPTVTPFGDAFLGLTQQIARDMAAWIFDPEIGISARVIFSTAEVNAATAQLTEECTGSFDIAEFTSLELSTAYRMDPLGLEWGYNETTRTYDVVGQPTGPVFGSSPPFAEFMNLDTTMVELSLENPVPATPPQPGDPDGLATPVDVSPDAQFFRLSMSGGPIGNQWTLDCIRSLDGETRLDTLVTATEEQALAMNAFYRNVPEEFRAPTELTLSIGSWSADANLTFSGANGVIGEPSDFLIDDASTMYTPFTRTF
ncbi:MAG: hypothetical protein AAF997_18225 [Myxococcota bacterium]